MDPPSSDQPQLSCPQCGNNAVSLVPLRGKEGNWFAKIECFRCGERAFFQIDLPAQIEFSGEDLAEGTLSMEKSLQEEWQEWVALKKRYLRQDTSYPSKKNKKFHVLLLIAILMGTLFFLLDQYHLLGVVLENVEARQQVVDRYVQQLALLPCFSDEMLEKIQTVPVHYTPESVYHHNQIQYGETGQYWGKFQIKIHRSNFWFFGWPKKSQLIDTLIHEFRHRASPWLGHNTRFYKLVQQDVQCALKHWKEPKK